jgi:hypothetical protein
MFENKVLRRVFCLRIEGITGGLKELLSEELLNLYFSHSHLL